MKYRIAVSSTDGKVVNQHFGKTELFYVVEADSEELEKMKCVEMRRVKAFCEGGDHDEQKLEQAVQCIDDCQYVLVSRIGDPAAQAIEARGIHVFEIPGIIQESVKEMFHYIELQSMIKGFIADR